MVGAWPINAKLGREDIGEMQQIRNVFIPHTHEDDEGVKRLKSLLELHGMTCRNGSITLDKFNGAQNEDYIKYQILAPRIRWAGAIVVYVSPDTQYSKYVNWEIEYAHKQGKRIVGVWEWGERGCDLPDALDRYADAIVGWNGDHIIEAIEGTFNGRSRVDDTQKWTLGDWLVAGSIAIVAGYIAHKLRKAHSEHQTRVNPPWYHSRARYHHRLRY